MPNEPMVTIKDEQGNLKQVPLSQLPSLAPKTDDTSSDTSKKEPIPSEGSQPVADEKTSEPMEDIEQLAAQASEQAVEEALPPTDELSETDIPEPSEDTVTEAEPNTDMVPESEDGVPATPAASADSDSEPVAEDDSNEPVSEDQTVAIKSAAVLAMTTPNTHVYEHTDNSAHAWDGDDHASLLDESLTNEDLVMPHEKNNTTAPQKDTPAPKLKESTSPFNIPAANAPTGPDLFVQKKTVPMQDIAPATPTARAANSELMGPTSEIRSMTLDDFRRLGGRGEVGIEDLRQKFTVLLDESILLYMRGIVAWQQSPLYQTYKDVLAMSVSQNISVTDALSQQSALSQAEFDALVTLQADLRL